MFRWRRAFDLKVRIKACERYFLSPLVMDGLREGVDKSQNCPTQVICRWAVLGSVGVTPDAVVRVVVKG